MSVKKASSQNKYFNQEIFRLDYTESLVIVAGLFMFWGFITSMNNILMPKLSSVFHLTDVQTILVQSTFFGAYFIISLIYIIVSIYFYDPITRFGYRMSAIAGLILAAFGCMLFFPAADLEIFELFLAALFILASGITILQIGSNAYVTFLGKKDNEAGRLNLCQAINSFGTTLAPFTGILIFSNNEMDASAETVKLPYIALSMSLLFFSFLLTSTEFPKLFTSEGMHTKPKESSLSNRHLILATLAIFMYVGAEVSIGSFLPEFISMDSIGAISQGQVNTYLSLYWGGAMVGRFFGYAFLAKRRSSNRIKLISILVIITAILVYYTTEDISIALTVVVFILLNIAAFYLGDYSVNKTLGLFAFINIILLGIVILTTGRFAFWGIISIGLFNSIMFPSIYTLGIRGLGLNTYQGSALLVLGAVGGALIPPIQNVFSNWLGLQYSFLVPILCYGYIIYFATKGYVFDKEKR